MSNDKDTLPPLSPLEVSKIEEKIWEIYEGGGGYAHNIIGLDLKKLSRTNGNDADRIYDDLLEAGY
jgi:hypothetical protein